MSVVRPASRHACADMLYRSTHHDADACGAGSVVEKRMSVASTKTWSVVRFGTCGRMQSGTGSDQARP
jgi:hypothetical protein